MLRSAAIGVLVWALCGAMLAAAVGVSMTPPTLVFRAPPGNDAMVARVEALDRSRLVEVMQLVGVEDSGRPILVELIPEHTPEADRHPSWMAGFTIGGAGPIVLFPGRAATYPHDALENVLRHEVAHVLTFRAVRGRRLPRWFNEGVAMAAERERNFSDEGLLAIDLLLFRPVESDQLDDMFHGGVSDTRRAYALSAAVVHDLLERAGPTAIARTLALVRGGRSFSESFSEVAGETPDQAIAMLWQRRSLVVRWLPFLTSSFVLWMGVTMLALVAIRRRRAKSRALRAKWEAEEREPGPEPESEAMPESHETIH